MCKNKNYLMQQQSSLKSKIESRISLPKLKEEELNVIQGGLPYSGWWFAQKKSS